MKANYREPMAANNAFAFRRAESPEQIAQARELFLEYANSLGFSLCFQSFDQELASLPGDYAPPDGRLLLATSNGDLAGCVALHKLESDICEMKRLFVRPRYRGKGLGRQLADKIITEARQLGYKKLRPRYGRADDENCSRNVPPIRLSRNSVVPSKSDRRRALHGITI